MFDGVGRQTFIVCPGPLKHVWSNTDEAAEQAWYACAHQTCLTRGCPNEQNIAYQTREQKKCFTFLIKCLMAFKFYQTRPNPIKHDQTAPNKVSKRYNVWSPNNVWWWLVAKHLSFVQALKRVRPVLRDIVPVRLPLFEWANAPFSYH